MEYYRTSIAVRAPLETLFKFFADPNNLVKVTPRGAGLKVEPVELPLKIGSRVRIRFRYGLIPIHWELSIRSLKQGDRFIDWQEKGPFKEWRHTHLFSRTGNMTTVVDMVEYELPYGFFGPLLNALVIRPAIASYFGYRQRKLVEIFGAEGVEAKGEARRGREGRDGSEGRGDRGKRGDRDARPARGERSDRGERTERGDRGARTERAPSSEREDRTERETRGPRGERRERGERGGRGRGRGGRDRGSERGAERGGEPQRGGRERDDRGGERGRDDVIRDSGATDAPSAAKAPGVRRPTTEAGGEWVDEHLARAAGKILEREKRERLRDREGAEIDDGETVRPRRPATEELAGDDDAIGAEERLGDDGLPRRRRRRGGRGRRGRTRGTEGRESTADEAAPWSPEGARVESDERQPRSERASFADNFGDDDAGRDDNGDNAREAAPRREPRDVDAVRAPRGDDSDTSTQDAVSAPSDASTREQSERGGRRDDGRRDREGGRDRGGRGRGGRDRGDRGSSRGGGSGGSHRRHSSGDDDRDIDGEAPEREKPHITPIYFPGTSFTADDEAWSSAPPATPPLPGDAPASGGSLILPGPRRSRTWGRGPQRVPVRAPATPKTGETSRAREAPPSPDSIESSTENT